MVNLVLSCYSWEELSGSIDEAHELPLAIAGLATAPDAETAGDEAEKIRQLVRPDLGYSSALVPTIECLVQCIAGGTKAGATFAAGLLVDFSGEVESIDEERTREEVLTAYEAAVCRGTASIIGLLDGLTDPIARDACFRLLIDCVHAGSVPSFEIKAVLRAAIRQHPEVGPDYLESWVREL